jgi:hypothetical protein
MELLVIIVEQSDNHKTAKRFSPRGLLFPEKRMIDQRNQLIHGPALLNN